MDRAIRVECRQTMVNYRKPASFIIKETFPLPPYSTVLGMVHRACDFKEYHSMQVSVQGIFTSTVADLYTRYSFGNAAYEEGRHSFFVEEGEKKLGVFKGIANTELITEISLILHIVPQEEDFDVVQNFLRNPVIYPALGRHEDLLDIQKVEHVSMKREEVKKCRYDIYVPLDQWEEENSNEVATVYRIQKEFFIDPKTNLRRWKVIVPVKHMPKESLFANVLVDEKGDVVFLA